MPSEHILFDSTTVRIGRFVCTPEEPDWDTENIINGTIVVFPSVPVRIHQADYDPVLADRNVVMYYNDGHPYRRGLLDERGDDAVWIALKGTLACDLLAEHRARTPIDPETPFDVDHGPSPADCFLRHKALSHTLEHNGAESLLQAEEAAIALVSDLLRADGCVRARGRLRAKRTGTERSRREIAENIRELLATDPGAAWTLERIVDRVCVSPSHLCRIFKEQTGMTIHRYLMQLRLREAADAVLGGERNLALLATRLGFSTHSHFSEHFRRSFGLSPNRLRRSDVLATIVNA